MSRFGAPRSKLEDEIYESCVIGDSDLEMECLDVHSQLVETHFQAQKDCDADPSKCALLRVLDRLAWGTTGSDGLQLLQHLRECVEAIHQMHQSHWSDAFESLDTDHDGMLSEGEFRAALRTGFGQGVQRSAKEPFKKEAKQLPARKLSPDLTEQTSGQIFRAADLNLDGFIDRAEFADCRKPRSSQDFLRAGAIAGEPLKKLKSVKHSKSSGDLLMWAMHSNMDKHSEEEKFRPIVELADLHL
eukprot:g22513.t1